MYTQLNKNLLAITLVFTMPLFVYASDEADQCLLSELKNSDGSLTAKQILSRCDIIDSPVLAKKGLISKRIFAENKTSFDPYVITPHKMNYILPVSMSDDINKEAYDSFGNWAENVEDIESKFQLSLKVPLNYSSMFVKGDGLYFGFTLNSWWQIYSDNISKPFRETNYQPELFYLAPLDWHPFESNTGLMVGVEHQSNGRTQLLSRSWNRVYLNFLYEKDNFALSFRPWWRIPEDDKESELSAEGDDNPNIGDFMGHFELGMVYKWNDLEFSFKGRENFSTHKGGIELGTTFPLWGKLRGYIQYTAGYGESLIDYNHSQQRLGIGIALTNVL